ncbi:MAG: hypothetical protein RL328_210 [Acidobacteriota bacterium]
MARLAKFLLLAALAVPGWAQRQMSVAQLEQFIKSSIDLKHKDKDIADIVKTLRLTERIDAAAVENLQGLGAGPRTLEALRLLIPVTAKLPAPAPPAPVAPVFTLPPPTAAEQSALLEQVRHNALDYSDSLPNFICTQVTRRYVGAPGLSSFRLMDTIQEQLSFVEKKENYKVVLINNLPVKDIAHDKVGGATSSGEFGSMLLEIFQPDSRTEFRWDRWATLRGRRTHVFEFRVLQRYSKYLISDRESGREMVAGYRGLIYADPETKMVMRIKFDAEGLQNFPINRVSLDLNYDFVTISGRQYVLPLKAELQSAAGAYGSRNEVEFRRYERFSADATIIYDVPDEIPADQLEEQPIK